MRKDAFRLIFVIEIALCCLTSTKPGQAQLVPDTTLPNNSSIITEGNTSLITEGTQAGSNLFHSFEQFSIPNGNVAHFNNTTDIQNIISRVTGKSISTIDGLIQANGSANLFFINPNGIIFGRNASLDIGGAFLATTASSLKFSDSNSFSATTPQATPLLNVNVPIGLQFGEATGSILNQSRAIGTDTTGSLAEVGLQVKPGKTLALVGSNVILEGGYLTAEEGRIELGSVAEASQVNLQPTEKGWFLGYEGVNNFKDIQLFQGAALDTSGNGGGDIQLFGRGIMLNDSSFIISETLGSKAGGLLAVNATDFLQISGGVSGLYTITSAAGKAGDITLNTENLRVENDAVISTQATPTATGSGGNLTVIARDAVEVINASLDTLTQGFGNAGDLLIETGQLMIEDGGQVSASSVRSQGNGGNIQINASNAVNLVGVNQNSGYSSALFTRTSGQGQAGNIAINTGDFRLANGAIVDAITTAGGNSGDVKVRANTFEALNGGQVLTTSRGSGKAGNIKLNTSGNITFAGSDPTFAERIAQFPERVDNQGSVSGLFANTAQGSTANGGNVTIETDRLKIQDRAEVAVSSEGTGNAGFLELAAKSVRLENGGKLFATTASGEGGDINLTNLNLLVLRDRSEISTSASEAGNGGNININTELLVGTRNSDITTTAFRGRGGNIQINTQGIFGLEPRSERTEESDITAISSLGLDGVVEINRPNIDPNPSLVFLLANLVDASTLVAQGCSSSGDNLTRQGSEFIVSGRGGLPPNPAEVTRSDRVVADLGTPFQDQENRPSVTIPKIKTTSELGSPLVEASGWMVGEKGEVILTAATRSATTDIPWLTPTSCHRS